MRSRNFFTFATGAPRRLEWRGRGLRALCAVAAATVALVSSAAEPVDPAVEKRLRATLGAPAIGLDVSTVERAEIPGMYRVELERGLILYTTENGDYFFTGDLYATSPTGYVNLAEQRRAEDRRELVDNVPMEQKIVFSPEGETRAAITVFTDVTCFYCQKLHKEVPELNKRGVEVRYMAYPRQGIGSPGFRQLASAWCADDRQSTLTRLKNKETLEENVCPGNPVAEQFALGRRLGVNGTPAIVMADGTLVPGYQSADALMTRLGLE